MFVLSQKHIRQQLVKSAGGSTQINVGKPAVLGVEFFVPPMKLQEQFATFVEQTDKSKFEIQQSLEKLETLKKALMQKYFG
jgi:type I restriction enzyme S subunit